MLFLWSMRRIVLERRIWVVVFFLFPPFPSVWWCVRTGMPEANQFFITHSVLLRSTTATTTAATCDWPGSGVHFVELQCHFCSVVVREQIMMIYSRLQPTHHSQPSNTYVMHIYVLYLMKYSTHSRFISILRQYTYMYVYHGQVDALLPRYLVSLRRCRPTDRHTHTLLCVGLASSPTHSQRNVFWALFQVVTVSFEIINLNQLSMLWKITMKMLEGSSASERTCTVKQAAYSYVSFYVHVT